MFSTAIIDLLNESNILYSVIANLSNTSINVYGDKDRLPYDSLVESLFGNMECIRRLYDSLLGQVLPQSWVQGTVKCIVSSPQENIIIGMFYIECRNPIKSYKWAKELNNILIERWKS